MLRGDRHILRSHLEPWGRGGGGGGGGVVVKEEMEAGFPRGAPTEAASCGPPETMLHHPGAGGAESSSFTQGRRPTAFPAPSQGVWWGPAPASLGLGSNVDND